MEQEFPRNPKGIPAPEGALWAGIVNLSFTNGQS